jgi:ribonuclease E
MDNKTNKMLIDATHPEETRVVVLKQGRVEEFDYESAARKLLRGSIYLAKVTRVEPSLQAAFVEYGGNRHGFLAFNEIHPDYYQIPMSDRQALIDEEAAAEAEADAEADARAERRAQGGGNGGQRGGRDGGRDRGRDGGRDGGRNGGRNGNRHRHGGQTAAADGSVQPGDEQPHIGDGAPLDGTPRHETAADATGLDHGHDQQRVSEAYPTDAHSADAHTDAHGHDHASVQHSHEGHAEPHDHQHATHEHAAHDPAAHVPAPAQDGHTSDSHAHDAGAHSADGHSQHDAHSDDHSGDQVSRRSGADHIEEVPENTEAPEIIGAGADDDAGQEDEGGDEPQDRPRRQRRRQYKIQEVIKRRQVILVQVVKEERGNKGAALTTYLSLAGRYTVLMPNTGRGGGISRKITQPGDRKRLKAIAQELDVQEGMGLIIRTAGAARTSQEIKRDYEYLLRLWESVRELTLQSTAPSLVYEEGNLIKRSIRDLYTKEIDEVVVAGDQAYEDAHAFMRMLMPSHVKNVTRYTHPEAIFSKYPIERQLTAMFSPYVTLKSGGYIVINQTEALVSIDVNSGKSTREYSIEDTALATNLEASDEIARQLKLRDLAGLIVIDFIDMEEKRNNRKVEHRLTDALRFDRARIQVGRISHFGLMEMSRQRMRTGVLEGSTSQCPHCQGTGMIRSTESVALAVLRGLEDHLAKDARSSVNVLTTAIVALYILNNKRSFILDIERRYGVAVAVQASDRMQGANFAIERSAVPLIAARAPDRAAVSMDWGLDGQESTETDETLDAGDRTLNEIEHVGDDEDRDGANSSAREGQRDGQREGQREGGQRDGQRNGERDGGGRGRRRRRGRDRDRPEGDRGPRPQHADQGGQPAQVDHNGHGHSANGHDGEQGVAHLDAPHGETEQGSGPRQADGRSDRPEGDSGPRRGRRRGRRGGRRGREHGPGLEGGAEGQAGQPLDAAGHDDVGQDGAEVAHDQNGHDHSHDHAGHDHAPDQAAQEHGTHSHEAAHDHVTSTAAHTAADNRNDVGTVPPAHVAAAAHDHSHDRAPTAPSAVAPPVIVAPEPRAAAPAPIPVTQIPEAPEDPTKPRRRGWWQRRGLGE